MNIKEAVNDFIVKNVEKQMKPLKETIRKEIYKYIHSKGFLKILRRDLKEAVDCAIDDGGILSILIEECEHDGTCDDAKKIAEEYYKGRAIEYCRGLFF